jgi:TolB-like protein/tRNA A-37 threonylcarbamoyl transferase component Bud32
VLPVARVRLSPNHATTTARTRLNIRGLLERTLGTAYTIERELGGGGMSRVFVAVENALDRKVVIKVLAPELAASVSADRFAREIRLAARLQQANIVTLLSAGETELEADGSRGLPYYTMPFVEGESLRHLLVSGHPIPESRVVHVLHDVARALVYAHEHGVVHRDIKPENILLSGDTAVVTDFGIAKALAASRTQSDFATLTGVGAVVGTPQYMAPEQLLGEADADHRVDLYAFGCVAYELLAGHPPFHGRTASRLFAAHVNELPQPLGTLRADVTPVLASVVMQCLAKHPDERPHDAREILVALDQVATPRTDTALPASPAIARLAAPGPWRARWWLAGVASAVLLVAAGWRLTVSRRGDTTTGPEQIAVLPFINVGGDPAQEYFADGMSVALTTALSKVPGLQLTARSLAFTYKGKQVDVRKAGLELGVSSVLEGTVQRAGNRLRVTAQLTNVKDGGIRWTSAYDRAVDDLFTVQDNITDAIVGELRGRLTGAARSGNRRRSSIGTANLDAYDRFMHGVYLLDRRGAGVAQSVGLFNEAIALDSAFAPAYAKLSEALELLPYFSATSAVSVEQRAMAAAQHALALDSTIPEAHVGLALLYGHAYRWREADEQFRLAMADDSSSAVVRLQYGRNLMQVGRLDDAITQLRVATRLDPLSATAFVWLAHVYAMLGQGDSATAIAHHSQSIDPVLLLNRSIGALDLAWAGHPSESRALLAGFDASAPWMGQTALGLAAAGDMAGALRVRRDLERLPRDTWMIHTALSYANLAVGDTSRALTEMEASRAAREVFPKWLSLYDPVFNPVRKSARFAAIARSFGLPDAAR